MEKSIRRRESIASRWIANTLLVVVALLVAANFLIYYFTKQYYYGTAESCVISEANASQSLLARLYESMGAGYSAEIRGMVEEFEKKDRMELMSINREGRVSLSSSGFSPDYDYKMPDYEQALESDDKTGVFIGKEGGENVIAVTILIDSPSSSYRALRFVASLEKIDGQLGAILAACVISSAFIVLLVLIAGMSFVKSIAVPLKQMSRAAKKLAGGDFSERIPVKSNDEIGQLSRAFNEMANELENSEQIKNDFISSVSHELRTPLTAIKGWSETISEGYDEETFSKGMKVITRETRRLEEMVEELLDFSRIQSGRFTLNMTVIDVIAELEDALLIYIDKARKENKELEYNYPEFICEVVGDKSRLRQVFINIIDNAVKYTDEGGKIAVEAEKNDGAVIISVKDTGCGIAKSDLPKVKQKFYKANSTKRGSGIGLAVADEIVKMHGGALEVESEQGKGTQVTVLLPLSRKRDRGEDE